MNPRTLSIVGCAFAATLVAGLIFAGQTGASEPVGEWPTYGGDYAETRYSALAQIDTSNVHRLAIAWSHQIGEGGGNQEATPLYSHGVLYGITNWSIAFALDAHTGDELWRFDPKVDRSFASRENNRGVCCGVINRGLALAAGKVIVPVLDGRLVALDQTTGKRIWSARALPEDSTGYSLTMAPRVIKDKIIVGFAGGEFVPHRGFFSAFDVNDGHEVWRFYTVPGDPSKPFENAALEKAAKTWAGAWWKYGGGGPVWDGLSYDPESNLIYVGTGNGAPWPQALRHPDRLDNLYVSSILAVNPDNGQLVWHYQAVPGDSWDYDSVQQMILADIPIGGRERKVLMQANKAGFFYVLDRITGQFISATPFSAVNWASGHDPVTGRPRINPQAYYTADTAVTIYPGPSGAANWSAKAYSPQTGLVYMPINGATSRNYMALPFAPPVAHAELHNGVPRQLPDGAPEPAVPPIIGPDAEGSFLVAFDPATHTERWRAVGGGGVGGGVVATAGHLVFQILNDGRLLAYPAEDGKRLLEIQTDLRGMGPPISYQVDGKQQISFLGGSGLDSNATPPRMFTFALAEPATLP